MSQKIKLRRGSKAELDAAGLLDIGEVGYATDTQEVFVGNGIANTLIGKIITGLLANIPTAGLAGRSYYASDSDQFFIDTGSAWTEIGEFHAHHHDADYVNVIGDVMTGPLEASVFATANDADNCVVLNPSGAYYNGTGGETGAIKILLPVTWTSDMINFTVKIYNYLADTSMTIDISGYNYFGGTTWTHTTARVSRSDKDSGFTPSIRYGYDSSASKCAIWIGETTSVWEHTQIQVFNFVGGHDTVIGNWKEGWNISVDGLAATNVNRTITATDSLPVAHWDNIEDQPTNVWSNENQGSGTLMDADTVDGQEASEFENVDQKGIANGYAELDAGGKVPAVQLPSFVEDVIEVANFAALPGTGTTQTIYVTLDNNKTFRWSGSVYLEISPSEVTRVNTKTGDVTLDTTDLADFTTAVQSDAAVAANTANRHAHSNKTILDATTASFTSGEKTRLAGMETGATADQTKTDIDALEIDAGSLDGINGSDFIRSDVDDTFAGDLTGSGMLRLSNGKATSKTSSAIWANGTSGAIMMDSHAQRRICWNDGGGNFHIRSGSYFNSGEKYVIAGEGAAAITMATDAQSGAIQLKTAVIGTNADDPITYSQTLALTTTDFTLNGVDISLEGHDHDTDYVSKTTSTENHSFSNFNLVFNYSTENNVDHIWYDDGPNTFTFSADTTLKGAATGNIACKDIDCEEISSSTHHITGISPGLYLMETDTTDENWFIVANSSGLSFQSRDDAQGYLSTPFRITNSGYIKALNGEYVNEFSTDTTLSGNSVNVLPTERAVKTYVDTQLAINASESLALTIALG